MEVGQIDGAAASPGLQKTDDETGNGGKNDKKEYIPPLDVHKLTDNDHGNKFQSKLLLLCFIRAINKNYENFYLGTELEGFGGKFDDVIFIRNDGSAMSFLYLQAKHGLHEKPHPSAKSITTKNLLNNHKGDFSLPKYLGSYLEKIVEAKKGPEAGDQVDCKKIVEAKKGPEAGDQVDCVICTNFGFNDKDLKNNGIELEAVDQKDLSPLVSDLLTFDTEVKWLNFLANILYGCAKEKKTLDKQDMLSFKSYLPILFKEKIIASSPNIEGASSKNYVFHPDFLEDSQDNKRSIIAKELRKTLIALELGNKDEWKTWRFTVSDDIPSAINSVDENLTRKTKLPTCYRFKSIPWLSLVANVLRDCATRTAPTGKKKRKKSGKKALDWTEDGLFQKYLAALLKENVIDTEPVKDNEGNIKKPEEYGFHADFIGDSEDARSEGGKELRKIITRLAAKDKVKDQDKEKDNWKNWTFVINEIAPFKNINEFNGITQRKLVFSSTKKSGNVTLQDIATFFDRFLIAINTPNENELDDILKYEVANQLKLLETDLQLNHISKEFANWFKEETNKWLSADEGWNISFKKMKNKFASIHAVVLSTRNQKLLNQKCCEFNGQKIGAMVQKFNDFFGVKNLYRILHITTPAPELSAIKLIAALKNDSFSRKKYFIFHDRLLWTTPRGWREFEKDCMMTMMKEDERDQLLVVVCNDDDTVQVVIGGSSTDDNIVCLFNLGEWESIKKTKYIIVITKPQIKIDIVKGSESILLKDTIEFDQLSQEFVGITERKPEQRSNSGDAADGSSEIPTKFKTTLMDAKILFQGKKSSIRELIPPGDLKNVFHSDCLTAFLTEIEKKGIVTIPSFDTSSHIDEKFQESLYITRRINEPFNDEQFREQLAKELGCSVEQRDDGKGSKIYHFGSDLCVHENGKFRWLNVENDDKKKEIWKKMNTILENKYSSAESSASPYQKFDADGFAYDCISSKGPIIISSFAGTGKSFFLSRCYRLIKSKHPDWWVIKINLADHSEALRKVHGTFNPSTTTGIDFLTSLPDVVGSEQSPFVRSLLKHRLLAGDRIVLMLDGFDEIDDKCREAVIKLIKVATALKTACLVTTRPHVANDLQYQLSQLAYTLDNFNEEDQIECVTKFWKDKLLKGQRGDENGDKVKELETYAKSLINHVTESLKDEHRAFIGIPLQCRIVAECFLEEASRKITQIQD